MRIAYLSTFYPYRGGIAQFNASLLNTLKQQGHEVRAFTFTRQYPGLLFPGKTQFVTKADKAERIEADRVLDSINPLSFPTAARKIAAFEPDLLLMKYWMTFLGYSLGSVAKRLRKKAKIMTVLDNVIPHEKRIFDTFLTKYFLKQNHAFVAMSDAVMHDLHTLSPHAPCLRKDHPLYDHFGEEINEAEARKQLGLDPDKKTLLFFGIIRKYKGLDILIDAFGKLNEDYQLLIAGECYDDIEYYKNHICASNGKDRIHLFDKYIPDNKVPLFFSAADVCMLPYRSATQSGITAIAYHFKVPLIATDVGGLRECIAPFNTGIVVKTPDANYIADAIRLFFSDARNKEFKQNIFKLINENSWGNFARSIIEFIQNQNNEKTEAAWR